MAFRAVKVPAPGAPVFTRSAGFCYQNASLQQEKPRHLPWHHKCADNLWRQLPGRLVKGMERQARPLYEVRRQSKLLETPKLTGPLWKHASTGQGVSGAAKSTKPSQLCTIARGVLTQGHRMACSSWACWLTWLSAHSLPTPASSSCLPNGQAFL